MKKSFAFALLLAAGLAPAAQAGILALSNTGQLETGFSEVGLQTTRPGVYEWRTQQFTAAEDWTLTSVDLLMDRSASAVGNGGFFLQLWSDNGADKPGAVLTTFAGTDNPLPALQNVQEAFSYTGTYSLSAGTSYWLVAGLTSQNGSTYEWSFTLSANADAGSRPGWAVSTVGGGSEDNGTTWGVGDQGFSQQYALYGDPTGVPVPATPLLMLLGLAGLAWRGRQRVSRTEGASA